MTCLVDVVVVVVVVESGSLEVCSFSRGRIRDASVAGELRRGRVERERVVARRRWLQKRQCWVWIGRVCVDILGVWWRVVVERVIDESRSRVVNRG